MGTRGLTVVVKDGINRIAQYGQWDHYPYGQGLTALNFVSNPENIRRLEGNLDKIEWLTDEVYDEKAGHIGNGSGWITQEQSNQIDAIFPYISRDHGAEILYLVANYTGNDPIYLQDGSDFADNSLFCEQAYVIDLDTRVFEVYDGFQNNRHSEGRFAKDVPNSSGYYPVRLVKSYSLDNLPTVNKFLEDFEEGEDED